MKNANKYILLAAFLGILAGLIIKNFPDSVLLQYFKDIIASIRNDKVND